MTNNTVEKLSKRLKRQRILIIILFICIPVAAYFTPQYFDFGINPVTTNKFTLIDPLRKFISQDDYITNIQNLRDYLSGLGKKYPISISVYYEQINSGSNISVNKNLRLYPASLLKLPIAIIVMKKVEDKKWSLDTKLMITKDDLIPDSGSLFDSAEGKEFTVGQLLSELLINSDNTAQHVLQKNISQDEEKEFIDETGLEDLFDKQGYVSAKEYTRLLRVLYTSSFLKMENSEKILELMSQASFHDFLSQGIPQGIKFSHKFGENEEFNVFLDSGIVYVSNKPYMITVMLKGNDGSDETRAWAVQLMKEISLHAYDASK